MASRPRPFVRDTRRDRPLDYEYMAVNFSLPSESLLTPPPSSPEPFDSPHLASQNPASSNDITQTDHSECEWCLGPDICIRNGEGEKVDEEKVSFWSTLSGGRIISLAAVNRILSGQDSSCHSSSNSEMSNMTRPKTREKLEGEESKRQLRIARSGKEDKESEERRKWIWEMRKKWPGEEVDEMPLMKRMKKRGREKEETKKMWKRGGAKW